MSRCLPEQDAFGFRLTKFFHETEINKVLEWEIDAQNGSHMTGWSNVLPGAETKFNRVKLKQKAKITAGRRAISRSGFERFARSVLTLKSHQCDSTVQ